MLRILKKGLGKATKRDPLSEKDPKKQGSKKPANDAAADEISAPGPWMQAMRGPLSVDERQRLLAEHKKDIALVDILSRIVDSGAVTSAAIHTQQGKKGRNQDAMIVWEEFLNQEHTTFAGVFDGHGPFGHLVAKRVRDTLPSLLSDYLVTILDKGDKENSPLPPEELEPLELTHLKGAFKGAFLEMDSELRNHPTIDSFCSGTTAICALRHHNHLFVSNLGDSRLILGSQGPDGKIIATQLSVDLKPDLPDEKRRIRASKGRVFALPDEPDVTRVWLPHEDTPGLAMARAFGDLCLKDYGIISAPDVTHYKLTDQDKFIVLASDGVWDVLENQEVIQLVASLAARKDAANRVIQTAVRTWREKYPFSKTDDCACVVLFLDGGIDVEGPLVKVAAAQAKLGAPSAQAKVGAPNTQAKVGSPNGVGERGPSLAEMGLLGKKAEKGEKGEKVGGEKSPPKELPEESLIARADSVVNLSAVVRAMDDEAPADEDGGSALVARADSVTTITRKL
ncbi:protein phosphatase 2C [Klebsormidium nitens]|uniref:protein-serine/threonine phosphatase n=1 Tax=Klebsormidium nitens TaxID=105231 RepID=A0A1Y1IBJ7_KLENI|nr:protein phosphatase 2C [Klebsormidium nitens]|eukprot:GAQ86471.1 protein phosphatase 2C [Klebsormidium nitens]